MRPSLLALFACSLFACANTATPRPAAGPNVAPPAITKASKPALDQSAISAITGGKPETLDNVVKISFPRDDVKVEVDGWQSMPPFMGLTSWTAFIAGETAPAMVMGDLVLLEDEVNPVMSALLDNGIEVTALHNHFFFDKPRVFFMHVEGEGTVEALAKGVKAAFDAERAIRAKSAQPPTSFGIPAPRSNAIDAAKLDAIFGVKGQAKDGMYKATMGRKAQAACGCSIGKSMGVNTWAAFGGTDEAAVVDGDFAVTEDELQAVLKSLRSSGIDVVAIHSHMTKESPRILFLHYWGHGKAEDLGKAVKKALDLTAWDGRTTTT